MAITKKNIAIQEQKTILRVRISHVHDAIEYLANHVPKFVRNGSHQVAVTWRNYAEAAIKEPRRGAARASMRELESELAARKTVLSILGEEDALRAMCE